MIEFRDRIAKENGIDMLVYTNEEGVKAGINPFDDHYAYTDIMKTQALKQALTKIWIYSGIWRQPSVMRRNPEQKKESSLSVIQLRHGIRKTRDRRCGSFYNTKIQKGESMRVFPISNWTEKDIWQYIQRENIEIVPLYFAERKTGHLQRRKYHYGG